MREMKNQNDRKWVIELTEEQLSLIANCVEDCHRFASGQSELHNTTVHLDNYLELRDTLQEHVEPLIAPSGRGSFCKWTGCGARNEHQRKFLAKTYGIYREIQHQLYLARGMSNVYTSPTLTCGEQGQLPVVKIKE